MMNPSDTRIRFLRPRRGPSDSATRLSVSRVRRRRPVGRPVDLARLGPDEGQARRDVQGGAGFPVRRVRLRNQVVLEPPPGDLRQHLRIAAHPDGHGLVIGDARAPLVGAELALLVPDVGEQAVTVLRNAAAPPRAARGRNDHHLVARPQPLLQELRDGIPRVSARVLGDVRVVEHDDEGPLHGRSRQHVGRHPGFGAGGYRLGDHHRLEAGDGLGAPVLLDREVLAAQPLQGIARARRRRGRPR